MTVEFVGNVALLPFMADNFYSLLIDLIETAKLHRAKLSYPAGAVIIGVACIESYVNELIFMTDFGTDKLGKQDLRRCGTDVLKKVEKLRTLAKRPEQIPNDLLNDFKLLIGLRGQLVHYDVQEEKPNDPGHMSRLEALERRLLQDKRQQGDVSLERILSAELAEWVKLLVTGLICALYKSGYEPPRPRWLSIVDPARFGTRKG